MENVAGHALFHFLRSLHVVSYSPEFYENSSRDCLAVKGLL